MAEMSPLRRRIIEDMTVRNRSPATERSCVHAVSKFSRYFARSPDRLDLEDVRAFQVHLVANGISWPALKLPPGANSRLVGVTDTTGAFRWKDYRRHGKTKLMTLAADEFIRRFLPHTLPDGFHRIRHYGFLANRQRAAKLALCRRLLDAPSQGPPAEPVRDRPSSWPISAGRPAVAAIRA